MHPISENDIKARLERDNPWRKSGAVIPETLLPRRVYFEAFSKIALDFRLARAVILMGPRRVGKTVMARQLVGDAIENGIKSTNILYVSVDTPVYAGYPLEKFLQLFSIGKSDKAKYLVIFDEIQYLKNWEVHLKDLVDSYKNVKFVATGSAAAALKVKSQESGAGRFTDFMLPPLTFYEFLQFRGVNEELITKVGNETTTNDINKLNSHFVEYLNYGGYPEVVLNEVIRANIDQFVRNDIIDKVLLKDLPSLYGITEIQELNKLFSFLAYNAGQEASLDKISRSSGISKPTIKKYIEYLESAFLIIKISTVDDNCRTLQRERNFKIYLNNPSMRAALFAPVDANDTTSIGHLTESAIFSQWQHSSAAKSLRYARWRNEGEVDIVYLVPPDDRPSWIAEIKWSDRIKTNRDDQIKHTVSMIKKHDTINDVIFTTRSYSSEIFVDDVRIKVVPSALYCYELGKNTSLFASRRLASGAPDNR